MPKLGAAQRVKARISKAHTRWTFDYSPVAYPDKLPIDRAVIRVYSLPTSLADSHTKDSGDACHNSETLTGTSKNCPPRPQIAGENKLLVWNHCETLGLGRLMFPARRLKWRKSITKSRVCISERVVTLRGRDRGDYYLTFVKQTSNERPRKSNNSMCTHAHI